VPGFTRISDADLLEMGLDPKAFSVDEIGFDAALYRDNESGAFTLAFRGSESSSWSDIREDWLMTNAGQVLGPNVPAAYEQARLLTAAVKETLGEGVMLTGHSMGGGLANYAAVDHNRDYTIFNAAGLSDKSIDALGDSVSNYAARGVVINDRYDPLTNLGGRNNNETLGGRHICHSALIYVDNRDFNGLGWLFNLLDPSRRSDAHSIESNITKYLAFECDRLFNTF
jgi:pimeloyl-ACP methyl ester carboxylesterase